MPAKKKRPQPVKKKRPQPARKPKAKKGSAKKRKVRRPSLFKQVIFALLGIVSLALIVILFGYFAHLLLPGPPTETKPPEIVRSKVTVTPPTYEIYPEETPKTTDPPPVVTPSPGSMPLVSIIIDDMGYDKKLAAKFLDLNVPLTFSVLPYSPFQEDIAQAAHSNGVEIMLHLPMEPDEYPRVDPGPGALLMSMSPDELAEQLTGAIQSVPGVRGVNNHMGSKMTASSHQMYQIFTILKKEGLFFIDSRTTANTFCKPSAQLFKVPFAERDIFLDHEETADFVRKQIGELILQARREGSAVGIGHPHLVTYEVLEEMLPELNKNVRLVPASEIVQLLN